MDVARDAAVLRRCKRRSRRSASVSHNRETDDSKSRRKKTNKMGLCDREDDEDDVKRKRDRWWTVLTRTFGTNPTRGTDRGDARRGKYRR